MLVRRGGTERPFKSPLYPLFPVIYVVIAAAVVIGNLLTTTRSEPGVTLLGVAVLLLGAATYVPWSRSRAR